MVAASVLRKGSGLDAFLLKAAGDVKPNNMEHNTVLRTVWLLSPHKNHHWKSTLWFKAAAGLLWPCPCWVILLLQWKGRRGVCRAGSASAFITIPGSRVCSPGLSISFWFSIPPPSSHLMVEKEAFLSHWIPKSSFLLSFCGGKKGFQEGSTKNPHQEPRQIWQCGSKAWRDGHCTELCSWRSKSALQFGLDLDVQIIH